MAYVLRMTLIKHRAVVRNSFPMSVVIVGVGRSKAARRTVDWFVNEHQSPYSEYETHGMAWYMYCIYEPNKEQSHRNFC